MIYSAKLTSKSQVVVPADIRAKLGLEPGGRGVWMLRGEEAVLMSPERYAQITAGILEGTYGGSRKEIEAYLHELREGWE